jgi:hypothetical protein
MMAPIALLSDLSSWIYVAHTIRTGCHAVTTSDTPVRIDIDNSIWALDAGINRADSYTNRIFTVVAHDGKCKFSHMRIMSLLNLFDPCSPYTERYIIFAFTDYGTCVAADTLS